MREIVLDTETTGLDPADGHRLLEIGAVELNHQAITGRVFHELINPERDVPEDAIRVHGHSAADLKDKPVFADVVDDFLAFIGEARLVFHNAEFDMRFVNAELTRLGRAQIDMDRVVDTLALARKKHPGQPNSLDALCDRYRINRSRRLRHGALVDAEILVDVYLELMGRQGLLSFDENTVTGLSIISIPPSRKESRPSRILLIGVTEATAHAEHVGTLGACAIWRRYCSYAG